MTSTEYSEVEERISIASQRQLIWWRFKRHKIALIATSIVIAFYLVVIFADFLATGNPSDSEAFRGLMPIQRLHFFDGLKPDMHVCAVSGERDFKTFKRVYETDCDNKIDVRFLAKGYGYRLFRIYSNRQAPYRNVRFFP